MGKGLCNYIMNSLRSDYHLCIFIPNIWYIISTCRCTLNPYWTLHIYKIESFPFSILNSEWWHLRRQYNVAKFHSTFFWNIYRHLIENKLVVNWLNISSTSVTNTYKRPFQLLLICKFLLKCILGLPSFQIVVFNADRKSQSAWYTHNN